MSERRSDLRYHRSERCVIPSIMPSRTAFSCRRQSDCSGDATAWTKRTPNGSSTPFGADFKWNVTSKSSQCSYAPLKDYASSFVLHDRLAQVRSLVKLAFGSTTRTPVAMDVLRHVSATHSSDKCRFEVPGRIRSPRYLCSPRSVKRCSGRRREIRPAGGHICAGTGLTPPTSAPELGSPLPHLHRDWPAVSLHGRHVGSRRARDHAFLAHVHMLRGRPPLLA